MAGIYGVSAYQQANKAFPSGKNKTETVKPSSAAVDTAASVSEAVAKKVETKTWSPIDPGSSLIPRQTEYGSTVGEVKLSDKAKDYYEKLKAKFGNMEFIAVSKDMKGQVHQNAASYGNANKMVVLIDEEKLERMAEDESYRKKYEGIISMSQMKLSEAKSSLSSSGVKVKNFGMSVDENGNTSFFATVEKSLELQKKRIEKKTQEKKEQRINDKKHAEKAEREERIQKAREERKAEQTGEDTEDALKTEPKEYVTFEAKSMEDLLSKVREYSIRTASDRVMTETERMLGSHVDFKG